MHSQFIDTYLLSMDTYLPKARIFCHRRSARQKTSEDAHIFCFRKIRVTYLLSMDCDRMSMSRRDVTYHVCDMGQLLSHVLCHIWRYVTLLPFIRCHICSYVTQDMRQELSQTWYVTQNVYV